MSYFTALGFAACRHCPFSLLGAFSATCPAYEPRPQESRSALGLRVVPGRGASGWRDSEEAGTPLAYVGPRVVVPQALLKRHLLRVPSLIIYSRPSSAPCSATGFVLLCSTHGHLQRCGRLIRLLARYLLGPWAAHSRSQEAFFNLLWCGLPSHRGLLPVGGLQLGNPE